jgi:signal peptidase II
MQATRGTSISTPSSSSSSAAVRGSRRPYLWLFGLVAVLGLAADVVTKVVAVQQLDPEAPVRLLGGALTLRLIRNPGAAFSLGESFTAVFALLSVAVLVFVIGRLAPTLGHRGWAVALGLLCAGVSGNLSDRVFRAPGFLRGHVVDFLQLPHWPIFNVADSCISAAAVLILVLSVIRNVGINGQRYQKPVPAVPAKEPSTDE